MRARRRTLSTIERRRASLQLFDRLKHLYLLRPRRRIALYLGNDGELDPGFFILKLLALGVDVYLPVLHPLHSKQLLFARYRAKQRMTTNRYGIAEPSLRHSEWKTARQLDVILMPLVAFDERGNRLGMGGGYYDRTLAFKHRIRSCRPRLYGLAYELQKVAYLPIEPWDIQLDGIVTEQRSYRSARSHYAGFQ